ncbi:MAG: hypothetical protein O3B43_02470, partial [Chloroflexi bacterium]|nr:hypothetical protein [Chloroflexota bacterium]
MKVIRNEFIIKGEIALLEEVLDQAISSYPNIKTIISELDVEMTASGPFTYRWEFIIHRLIYLGRVEVTQCSGSEVFGQPSLKTNGDLCHLI